MMNNLFSSFDPSTSIFQMNWMILIIPFLIPLNKMFKNKFFKPILILTSKLKMEISANMSNSMNKNSINFCSSLIILLLILNATSLMPFIFSSTAQIIMNFPLSFTLWITIISFLSTKKSFKFFSHLLPIGTPIFLMPIMIIIEMISNLIRPITLSVRLTANIIAGHLLMTLLGNFLLSMNFSMFIPMSSMMFILSILEMAVSLIQSYVFMTLICLYSAE